ncbi:MAG: dephospho-CoA kinase [Caldilineae bacterium]|nr:MAG: dephospho-CoA kinase [Caldilineae bacterium]
MSKLVIGLTGNIATGKSTILKYLAEKGAAIIDADKLAHRTMEPGGPAYEAVVRTFGRDILNEDGTINRKALGKIVFADAAALGRLEKIVHPKVFELGKQEIMQANSPVVILEAIKLLEAGAMVTLCDEVWVVISDAATQLKRLMETRGMDKAEAEQIIHMQPPQAAKVNQADRVIDNNGTLEELYAQLDAIWADLQKRYPRRLAALAATAG